MAKKEINAWAKLGGLRHQFSADDLDPQNSPALAQTKEQIRSLLIAWANDPQGLDKQFDEIVAQLREEFVRALPSLRVRYASVIRPLPIQPTNNTEH